ncbi:MAG: DUF2795 domain-containing protein [Dehalococcoidales bacterium]|nr:DUF2795 domain-containing protein [Dehalococcoidales bacterium]
MAQTPQERGGQKGGQASLHSDKVSAAQIQVYLKGIHYPANKQQVVNQAKSNNAPENVMSFLRRLPDRQYSRPMDVEEEFGKMK